MASASLFHVGEGLPENVVSSSSVESKSESEGKGRKEEKSEKISLHVLPCIDLLLDEGAVTIVWLHSLVQRAGDSVSSPSTCRRFKLGSNFCSRRCIVDFQLTAFSFSQSFSRH